MTEKVYSIDFGTSNTVVAEPCGSCVYLPGISQSPDRPWIPSLIYAQSLTDHYIGQEVRSKGLDVKTDRRFFQGFKRGIGQEVGFLPQLDGDDINFNQLGSWFLSKVIRALGDVNNLIFTVPIDSYETYGAWLWQVGDCQGVSQIRILDEPTAAALGYSVPDRESRCLVIDFGGGTLDLVLIDRAPPDRQWGWGNLLKWHHRKEQQLKPSAKVLAKVGQNLGGMDIDRWILQHQGIPINSCTLNLAETLKVSLSNQPKAEATKTDPETGICHNLKLDRVQFNQILTDRGLFQRLDQALNQIQQQSKASLTTIDRVLLVGGTCLMPSVQNWVASYFPTDRIELDRPLTAIAEGALQAANWQIKDLLYHNYGIRYWDKRLQQQHWHPLIKSGQTYPLDRAVELILGASIPNQTGIELVIGELGEATTEIVFESGNLVSNLLQQPRISAVVLNPEQTPIAKLNPLGQTGTDRVQIIFQIDHQRMLCISINDLLTKQNLLHNHQVIKLL